MVFKSMLVITALCGGCIGAALSHVPGKRGSGLLRALLLLLVAVGMFAGGLCLRAHSAALLTVLEKGFHSRLSKLAACGALMLLLCGLGLLLGLLRAGGAGAYLRLFESSRLHRRLGILLLCGGAALLLSCALLAGRSDYGTVRLNEVSAEKDYVELINTGDAPRDLEGYFLSDKDGARDRFCLPSLRLEPGECVLILADGTGTSGEMTGEEIHLNFALSAGETLWLSSPSGKVLDHVTVPEQIAGVSLTRQGEKWVLARATPGLPNDGARVYTRPTLDPPVLSLASGFYEEPQMLTITAAEGCRIRYTLDGSLPTEESPLYEGPLRLTDISGQPNRVLSHPNTTPDRSGVVEEPVEKGTVIRAAAFAGGACSEPVTGVYFVGDFSAREGRAILNFTIDPEELFGDLGIAVTGPAYDAWLASGGEGASPVPNYRQRGRIWEREAELLLWDAQGRLLLDQSCGLRIQGNTSRSYAYKRFSFYSRPIYGGSGVFDAQLFPGLDSHSVSTRPDPYDFMVHQLFRGLDIGIQDVLPVTVYINGEFYQETYLRERYDEQYFREHYGADPEDLILISRNELDIGTAADYAAYRELMEELETGDCADPAVWARIQRQIDPQSLADYLACNFYFNNIDWCYQKNYKLWRTRSEGGEGALDGRWRWLAYDMDILEWVGVKLQTPQIAIDPFHSLIPHFSGQEEMSYLEIPLIRSVLRNPDFRTLFIQTYLGLMNVNFSPEAAAPLLERYGLTENQYWSTFLAERPPYALKNLIGALELEAEPCGLSLRLSDPAAGAIRLNTVTPALSGGSWTGTWLTGVPLTVTAEAAEGWRFVGWEGAGDGAEPSLSLTPEGDLELTALFERAG